MSSTILSMISSTLLGLELLLSSSKLVGMGVATLGCYVFLAPSLICKRMAFLKSLYENIIVCKIVKG